MKKVILCFDATELAEQKDNEIYTSIYKTTHTAVAYLAYYDISKDKSPEDKTLSDLRKGTKYLAELDANHKASCALPVVVYNLHLLEPDEVVSIKKNIPNDLIPLGMPENWIEFGDEKSQTVKKLKKRIGISNEMCVMICDVEVPYMP